MSAIWGKDGEGWKTLAPKSFPDEQSLHDLIEEAPQLLPLSGDPTPIVVGREVQLGGGFADLLAIEPTGRPVVIEIKLARNSEARRAVVAQVLTYAAYLRGLSVEALETQVLARHLSARGYDSLAGAADANDQEGGFDHVRFTESLQDNLTTGSFRLVIVLDAAPKELVRLAGYLESVADKLLIDLITVAAYDVNGTTILVPQRVDPERSIEEPAKHRSANDDTGRLVDGSDDFEKGIAESPEEQRGKLHQLLSWARELERAGLVKLSTYHGKANRMTLLPRLQPENAGLVTIWNENGAALQFWRSMFERKAPKSLPTVAEHIQPLEVRQGNSHREFDDELLALLRQAYEEAAG